MKKITTSFLALSLTLASAAWAAVPVVKVTDDAGVNAEFVLADAPTVSYVAEGLCIEAGDVKVVYPADATYTMTLGETNGISDVRATRVELSRQGSAVALQHLRAAERVSAYSVDGSLLASTQADAEGCATIDLSAFKGVIIISTANQSFKIIK